MTTPTGDTHPVLGVFLRRTLQITTDPRFTRHHSADRVDWTGVLAEPGWSTGQRALITLAAALCDDDQIPPTALGANLTGPQVNLALQMCQTARASISSGPHRCPAPPATPPTASRGSKTVPTLPGTLKKPSKCGSKTSGCRG